MPSEGCLRVSATCNSLLLLQEPNLFLQLSESLIRLDKTRETKNDGQYTRAPQRKKHMQTYNCLAALQATPVETRI